jgi:hypothetical protein
MDFGRWAGGESSSSFGAGVDQRGRAREKSQEGLCSSESEGCPKPRPRGSPRRRAVTAYLEKLLLI